MIIYTWLLTIILITVGRLAHGRLRAPPPARGRGRDPAPVEGTAPAARSPPHRSLPLLAPPRIPQILV